MLVYQRKKVLLPERGMFSIGKVVDVHYIIASFFSALWSIPDAKEVTTSHPEL
jgi:hypothetical protein